MLTTRKRGPVIAAATLGLLLGVGLSACSVTKEDDSKEHDAADAKPTPSATPTEEATPTPSPSAATTASATPAATPAATPEAALLTATEFPQLNGTSPWTEGRTATAGQANFGLCQKFDILSIGAMNAVERSYRTGSSPADTAGQQVAEFPDAQNTVRANKVLEAWHDQCRSTLGSSPKYADLKVGPITDVTVRNGKGWTYLVSYTRNGTGHFHEFGVVYVGNRMTMLKLDHAGQDHNYEPGQDPMELAVKAASAKMG